MKPTPTSVTIVILATIVLTLASPAARADAIDGRWCHKSGKRLSIDGPRIVTPGGTRLDGNYDRHAFSYKVPAGEPQAGALSAMALIDDDTLQMQTGGGPTLIWNRCGPPIS